MNHSNELPEKPLAISQWLGFLSICINVFLIAHFIKLDVGIWGMKFNCHQALKYETVNACLYGTKRDNNYVNKIGFNTNSAGFYCADYLKAIDERLIYDSDDIDSDFDISGR